MDTNNNITDENLDKILKEREIYGKFSDVAKASQELKNAFFKNFPQYSRPLTYVECEAIENIFQKLARIKCGTEHHPDNWIDIANYARLANRFAK